MSVTLGINVEPSWPDFKTKQDIHNYEKCMVSFMDYCRTVKGVSSVTLCVSPEAFRVIEILPESENCKPEVIDIIDREIKLTYTQGQYYYKGMFVVFDKIRD